MIPVYFNSVAKKKEIIVPVVPVTFDPLKVDDTDFKLINDNKTCEGILASTAQTAISVESQSSGKYYAEVFVDNEVGSEMVGICTSSHLCTNRGGFTNYSWTWMNNNRYYHNSALLAGKAPGYWVDSSILQMAVDIDAGKIWWGLDNTWLNSGDPANGTDPIYEDATITGDIFLCYSQRYVLGQASLRGLTTDLTYTPPSGFSPWGE